MKPETLEAILDILQDMNLRISVLDSDGYDGGAFGRCLADIEALRTAHEKPGAEPDTRDAK
jgi:hypothetical protein